MCMPPLPDGLFVEAIRQLVEMDHEWIPKGEGEWEMIKMGVDEAAQGKGIGFELGRKILEIAREKGAGRLVLYTNSKLQAAVHLYEKLGFSHCNLECGTYGRCNVKMEFVFTPLVAG